MPAKTNALIKQENFKPKHINPKTGWKANKGKAKIKFTYNDVIVAMDSIITRNNTFINQ